MIRQTEQIVKVIVKDGLFKSQQETSLEEGQETNFKKGRPEVQEGLLFPLEASPQGGEVECIFARRLRQREPQQRLSSQDGGRGHPDPGDSPARGRLVAGHVGREEVEEQGPAADRGGQAVQRFQGRRGCSRARARRRQAAC